MADNELVFEKWCYKNLPEFDAITVDHVYSAWNEARAQDGVSSSADCILVPRSLIERWANVDAFNVPRGAAMELKVAAQMMLSTQQQPSAVVPEGYKVVPLEPVGDIADKGCQAYMEADGNLFMHRSSMGWAYRAMVADAPLPYQCLINKGKRLPEGDNQ
jgi:hypothetical protein